MSGGRIGDSAWKAGQYGSRCRLALRSFARAVAIARAQGGPCLSDRDMDWLAQQAWAYAKQAAHHARLIARANSYEDDYEGPLAEAERRAAKPHLYEE